MAEPRLNTDVYSFVYIYGALLGARECVPWWEGSREGGSREGGPRARVAGILRFKPDP